MMYSPELAQVQLLNMPAQQSHFTNGLNIQHHNNYHVPQQAAHFDPARYGQVVPMS